MDFALSEEHLRVQQTVREFARAELAPLVHEHDRRAQPATGALQRLAHTGLLGICLPVRHGGQGMDYLTLGLVCEELEAVDSSLRVILSVHVALNSLGLLQWADEEQKRRWLIPQARGEKIACFALTEPDAGSDVAAIRTSARLQDGAYILNGEKTWISLASLADHALVIARTEPDAADPHDGLSAFLVELDGPGISRGDLHGKLGVRAGSTGWIRFQDAAVPAASLIGRRGEGFKIAMSCLDNGRYTIAAGAAGLIRACLEASVRYARERHAFGREIGRFQLVQEKIARMARDYEIARLLYFQIGWLKNSGRRNTRQTSLAKWFATEAAFQAAAEAVQVHGAYGYSDEYDVERYLRNSKGAMIYEGTSEIHTLIQAGYALGYRQDAPLRCELPPYRREEWEREQ